MAMTVFETATLAFQQATIGFQESTVRFQEATVSFQNASLGLQEKALDLQELAIAAHVGVGLLHAALIGFGIWMMHRASRDRNRAMDDDRVRADQRHSEAMDNSAKRHKEAMAALKELIARTAGPGPSSPPSAA